MAQGDGQGLGQTTVNLAFDDHWIDPCAAIVQRIELANVGHTRIHINFHDTDIGPKWIGHIGWIIIADRFQTWFHTRDRLIIGGKGDFFHCFELFWCALNDKPIHIEFHIIIMHFQQIGRNHLCFCTDFAPRHCGCSTFYWCRA